MTAKTSSMKPEPQKTDPAKQQQRKVILAGALMCIPFCVFMWWIFGDSAAKTSEAGTTGVNLTLPEGKQTPIEGNKQRAAERAATEEAQNKRLMTLGDNSFSLLDDGTREEPIPTADDPMRQAQEANRAMQRQAQGLYLPPQSNAEVAALKEQVEALTAQLEVRSPTQIDPLELAEQQYRLAQKYLGANASSETPTTKKDKTKKSLIRPVREGAVAASTLNPSVDMTQERNLGFYTPEGRTVETPTNTIRICVADNQVVRSGGIVRLRLLEAVRIDGIVLPRNTLLYGQAQVAGLRLSVVVSSIEYRGNLFNVDATVYDLDGQPGLNVPDSKERNAIKEALASIGQSAGMSVNVTHSAGQQIVGELSRGGLTAASRYVSEKLKELKITLKANHQLLLTSKEQ